MGSYVCTSDDLGKVIIEMERKAAVSAASADPSGDKPYFKYGKGGRDKLIDALRNNRRLKSCYYCDNDDGNTIRLYDGAFRNDHSDLYLTDNPKGDYDVTVRGFNLGQQDGDLKEAIRKLFRARAVGEVNNELREEGQEAISTNNRPACLAYFEDRNKRGSDEPEGPRDKGITVTSQEGIEERYQELKSETYLDANFFAAFESLLKTHRQIILEGPPGSGKTFVAEKFSHWWTSSGTSEAEEGSRYQVIQFHESYGYEDFFQGIRPVLLDRHGKKIKADDTTSPVDKMVYMNVNGIFYELCVAAEKNKDARFVLIIDEINRGKASRIFGELLYLLEYREKEIRLASGESFKIPENVYIIGTMNTADRSIALVDYALRRRFKFAPLPPSEDEKALVLERWLRQHDIPRDDDIIKVFCKLNEKIARDINEHLVVGHSYFMNEELKSNWESTLKEIWKYSIMPLMGEYKPHCPIAELAEQFGFEAICHEAGVEHDS